MPVMRALFLLISLWTSCSLARAQSCNFSITDVDFGNLNLNVGGTPTTTGTFSAQCSGTPNSTITICPDLGDGTGSSAAGNPRYMIFGSSRVPYNLFQPSGQIWGSYVWPYAPRPPILSLQLNGSGTGSLSQIIDASITGLASTATAGLYQSVYSSGHTLIDYGYAPTQSCNVVSSRAARPAFTVRANNASSCNISTTAMNFGSHGDLSVNKTSNNQIAITCTNGVRYSIGLSNGTNGGTGPTARYMAGSLLGQKIKYGIYQNAGLSQQWGSSIGTDTISGVATGLTQTYNAFGQIPVQTTPPAGSYSDTVVVTVTY